MLSLSITFPPDCAERTNLLSQTSLKTLIELSKKCRWPLVISVLDPPEQFEAMFPKLDGSQIARLGAFGQQRDAQPHEVILELGDLHHGIFVILSGRVEGFRVSAEGETALHVLGRGDFTGDVNLLSGRGTLVRVRALEASTLLEIDRANLPQQVQRRPRRRSPRVLRSPLVSVSACADPVKKRSGCRGVQPGAGSAAPARRDAIARRCPWHRTRGHGSGVP